ncbi:hypothetical protein [Pseudidiomarina sediminum]|uniref:hypothetical protein n=1 Tax=Pseudidiomarina sediminum TaxID=431675 RepID=UPI001C965851|nr:hypothetical protein [Pseudidiomarina sediminum]MBY6065025.1 hypothetical protein [Pseudidiomarina sediminum]
MTVLLHDRHKTEILRVLLAACCLLLEKDERQNKQQGLAWVSTNSQQPAASNKEKTRRLPGFLF